MNPDPKNPTYYDILGLLSPLQNDSDLTAQTLRAAYRKALLQWHPDKSVGNGTSLKSTNPAGHVKFSVDQISTAYSVLVDPKTRAVYDKDLKAQKLLSGRSGNGGGEDRLFRTGLEAVDLDDLEYDETKGIWFRGCRCGDERGFEVKEGDLEEGQADGEVVVGCKGCSLWLRVLFGIVDDDIREGLLESDGHEVT